MGAIQLEARVVVGLYITTVSAGGMLYIYVGDDIDKLHLIGVN